MTNTSKVVVEMALGDGTEAKSPMPVVMIEGNPTCFKTSAAWLWLFAVVSGSAQLVAVIVLLRFVCGESQISLNVGNLAILLRSAVLPKFEAAFVALSLALLSSAICFVAYCRHQVDMARIIRGHISNQLETGKELARIMMQSRPIILQNPEKQNPEAVEKNVRFSLESRIVSGTHGK